MKKKEIDYLLDYACLSDIGKVRLTNEDEVAVVKNKSNDVLMLVCDGLGGHNKGDYASKTTINFIKENFTKTKHFHSIIIAKLWLQHIVSKANKLIFNVGENSPIYKGTGTTLVAALIKNNYMIVLNIGDSRAYLLNNMNKLSIISEDQSVVDFLRRTGKITEEEAKNRQDKNVLTNALGIYPSITYNSKIYKYNNEPLLLCSDGLFNNIKEEEIEEILRSKDNSENIVNRLIYKANLYGGSDNITAAVFKRSIK